MGSEIKAKIETTIENIHSYEKMLDIMPEDTVLGRLCIKSLLKKEKAKLEALSSKLDGETTISIIG